MPSPDQVAETKRVEAEQEGIRIQYASLKDNPALNDLLSFLDAAYAAAHGAALNEEENSTKALIALQRSAVYDKVRVYIRDRIA